VVLRPETIRERLRELDRVLEELWFKVYQLKR